MLHVSIKLQQLYFLLWLDPPTITETSHGREVEVRPGDDIILSCEATGFPEPTISWYKYKYNGDKEGKILFKPPPPPQNNNSS